MTVWKLKKTLMALQTLFRKDFMGQPVTKYTFGLDCSGVYIWGSLFRNIHMGQPVTEYTFGLLALKYRPNGGRGAGG
jgi:hypothetical protein